MVRMTRKKGKTTMPAKELSSIKKEACVKAAKQIAEIVRDMQNHGRAVFPYSEIETGTENFLAAMDGTYFTYLPDSSRNLVITPTANEYPLHCVPDFIVNHRNSRT